jgi:vacuolar-type H+-ATPase subunit F/Vma7
MTLCAFIGDEVSAAGFALAGIDVHVPSRDKAANLFRRLIGEAQMVLVTAEVAGWMPQEELRKALAAERPLVLVIPDVRGHAEPPDVAVVLKRQLGMAE